MNVTKIASIASYRSPLRPALVRVRPNIPGTTARPDKTRRKLATDVGRFFLNPSAVPQIITS